MSEPRTAEAKAPVESAIAGTEYPHSNRADDFEQAGLLYRVMKEDQKTRLMASIAGHLGKACR
jgi:catalase